MRNKILELLHNRRENVEVEFKSAKGGFPGSFWETFSAFANTNGGVIVLGVKEHKGVFVYDGFDDVQIEKLKKTFWDCVHNKDKVSVTLLAEKDVKELEIDGRKLLIFAVPRAPYDLKPVYLTRNPFGNTFKRNHEGDYRCTDLEVRLMFADAQHASKAFDNQILPNYSMADIDMATLKGYRQRFMLRRENHPWNDEDDMGFLTKLGAYRIDRETGKEGFTRAGILMFGKTESITDEVCVPWYFVDYQEKLSEDVEVRWSDRIYPDGTWEANLYQFFFRVYNKLVQTLPTPFQLEGAERKEETSAQISLREALVNALVHCNYAEQGNILVTRTKNQIVFRNPGTMLIAVEDFYAGSISLCRNSILQKFFVQLGYGEKAGSGADVISKGWIDNDLKKPVLIERVQPDAVSLVFDLSDLDVKFKQDTTQKKENITQKSKNTTQKKENTTQKKENTTQKGKNTTQKGKNTTQKKENTTPKSKNTTQKKGQNTTQKRSALQLSIIEYLRQHPTATREDMVNNIPEATIDGVKYSLTRLKKLGDIERVGGRKTGYWVVYYE